MRTTYPVQHHLFEFPDTTPWSIRNNTGRVPANMVWPWWIRPRTSQNALVLGEPEQSVRGWILRMLDKEVLIKKSQPKGKVNDLKRVGDSRLSLQRWNRMKFLPGYPSKTWTNQWCVLNELEGQSGDGETEWLRCGPGRKDVLYKAREPTREMAMATRKVYSSCCLPSNEGCIEPQLPKRSLELSSTHQTVQGWGDYKIRLTEAMHMSELCKNRGQMSEH